MNAARTLIRSAAVLGAATALGFAGAGAAMATTTTSAVDGNVVSVTFELESGDLGDTCTAVIAQTSEAAAVAAELAGAVDEADLLGILDSLDSDAVHTLPPAILVPVINPSQTVESAELPSNVYSLVSICLSDTENPHIEPAILVGDPMEAIMGSVESMSAGGGLDAMSSMLAGGEESDLGGILSSALGGAEGEGSPLDALSSGMGGGETAPA